VYFKNPDYQLSHAASLFRWGKIAISFPRLNLAISRRSTMQTHDVDFNLDGVLPGTAGRTMASTAN